MIDREVGRRGFLKAASAFAAFGMPNLLTAGEKGIPALTLGVISDTHIGTRESTAVLERTLEFFRTRKVDAVMICGDLADWGLLSGLKYVAEAWEKVFPHGKGAEGRPVHKLFCTGNHDYEGWWYGDMTAEMHALGYDEDEALVKLGMKKCWEEVFQEEFDAIRKRNVNGFDFISAEWHGYDETPGYDKTAEWFAAHGSEIDLSKPFFYYLHQPPAGTTSGSWETKLGRQVTDALSSFPNAVAFSGHTHWTLNDERSIWQGAYTAISVPSLSCTGVMGGYENGSDVRNGKTTKAMPLLPVRFNYEEPQGLVVTVFGDRMELERYDFRKFVHTAPTWRVPLPLARESRPYALEPRASKWPVPQFPDGAKLTLFTSNTETRGGNRAGGGLPECRCRGQCAGVRLRTARCADGRFETRGQAFPLARLPQAEGGRTGPHEILDERLGSSAGPGVPHRGLSAQLLRRVRQAARLRAASRQVRRRPCTRLAKAEKGLTGAAVGGLSGTGRFAIISPWDCSFQVRMSCRRDAISAWRTFASRMDTLSPWVRMRVRRTAIT